MGNSQDSDSGPQFSLAVIAAIICAFAGYDAGQWPGAFAAAAVAFGGVYALFAAIVIGLKLVIGGVVFVVIVASLKNRWDWLSGLFQ